MTINSHNSRLNVRNGFTLVELIIYTAIFSIVSITMTSLLVSITKVGDRTNSSSEVSSQLNFVMQNIQRLVKSASNIDITAGVSTSTLVLRMQDPAKDPTVISLSSSTVFLKEGSIPTTTLTSSNVVVNSLNFRKISQYPGHDIVYIDLAITNNNIATSSQLTRTLSSAIARVSAATFDSGLVPGTANNYDVGTTGSPWRNGYFSGVVGIGTVSPTGLFDVGGGKLVVLENGNVGIGTASPGAKLEIFNASYGEGDYVSMKFRSGSQGSNSEIRSVARSSDRSDLQFYTSTGAGVQVHAMTINQFGSVGIGTTTPDSTQKLVIGGINAANNTDQNAIQFVDTNNNSLGKILSRRGVDANNGILKFLIGNAGETVMTLTSTGAGNGNVGIGTTTPSQKLSVVGTIESTSGGFKFPDGSTQTTANRPAFGVYSSSDQSISSGELIKLTFGTEEFDTNSNFANSRFTPTVAGKYLLTASVFFENLPANTVDEIEIWKNGVRFKVGTAHHIPAYDSDFINVSAVVDANGSTDYFEIYAFQNSGSSQVAGGGQAYTYFSGGFLAP